MIYLQVEIQTTKGKICNTVESDRPNPVLADALEDMSKLDWANSLFNLEERPAKLFPGYLVILDSHIVQPWELGALSITDGQKLKIVQVVPGG